VKYAFILSVLALTSLVASADDLSTPAGLWQVSEDDAQPSGRVRIYEENGVYFGRIEPSSASDHVVKRCAGCTDERKDLPYDGLVIIRNMRLDGDEYTGGDVLDPRSGKLYGCKFRLTDGGHKLIMRGFFGVSLLGRSQTWQRVEASTAHPP
jgi:uncharacterized protein (DUF2147 family)